MTAPLKLLHGETKNMSTLSNDTGNLPVTSPATKGEITMNWERIQGNWKQVKGKAVENWGKLTDDDLDVVEGRREQLAGKIQERYGVAKEEAEKQVSAWERSATDDWFR
jgi:uncharacterized protein YjbJ (UPF0337 family)